MLFRSTKHLSSKTNEGSKVSLESSLVLLLKCLVLVLFSLENSYPLKIRSQNFKKYNFFVQIVYDYMIPTRF